MGLTYVNMHEESATYPTVPEVSQRLPGRNGSSSRGENQESHLTVRSFIGERQLRASVPSASRWTRELPGIVAEHLDVTSDS